MCYGASGWGAGQGDTGGGRAGSSEVRFARGCRQGSDAVLALEGGGQGFRKGVSDICMLKLEMAGLTACSRTCYMHYASAQFPNHSKQSPDNTQLR